MQGQGWLAVVQVGDKRLDEHLGRLLSEKGANPPDAVPEESAFPGSHPGWSSWHHHILLWWWSGPGAGTPFLRHVWTCFILTLHHLRKNCILLRWFVVFVLWIICKFWTFSLSEVLPVLLYIISHMLPIAWRACTAGESFREQPFLLALLGLLFLTAVFSPIFPLPFQGMCDVTGFYTFTARLGERKEQRDYVNNRLPILSRGMDGYTSWILTVP